MERFPDIQTRRERRITVMTSYGGITCILLKIGARTIGNMFASAGAHYYVVDLGAIWSGFPNPLS